MTGKRRLRTALVALLLTPLLVAASSGGCDCTEPPRLPDTNATGGCGNSEGSQHSNDQKYRNITDKEGKIARGLGYSKDRVQAAIHQVKREAGIGSNNNVLVNVKTGQVYVRTRGGGIGDEIGNLYDHLPPK